MRAALKPGGILAIEMGGYGNVGALRTLLRHEFEARGHDAGALDPWYFPTAEEYTILLQEAGFEVESAELVVRPTPLPKGQEWGGEGGLRAWLHTFGGPFLNALGDAEQREQVVGKIEETLKKAASVAQPDEYAGTQPVDQVAKWYDALEDKWTARYVRLRVRAVAV